MWFRKKLRHQTNAIKVSHAFSTRIKKLNYLARHNYYATKQLNESFESVLMIKIIGVGMWRDAIVTHQTITKFHMYFQQEVKA